MLKGKDYAPGKKSLEVALSPALLPSYNIKDKVVVVIDIFRASSAICTAIANGVKAILPVESLEEAVEYKEKGYKVAAERKGEVVKGFDFGNSPFSFMDKSLKGSTIVLTTSNCTRALLRAREASHILVGSFLNMNALKEYLRSLDKDVVLLCAGWNDTMNMEDTLFAGALCSALLPDFTTQCDAAWASMQLYDLAKSDMQLFLQNSSHSRRLQHLHIEKDIDYCLQMDILDAIPVFDGHAITALLPVLA